MTASFKPFGKRSSNALIGSTNLVLIQALYSRVFAVFDIPDPLKTKKYASLKLAVESKFEEKFELSPKEKI